VYRLVGHKWFFSAPMCDAFLVLAQAASGITCFLVPRFAPDGTVNAIRIQRLKDKLGDRSNASSEVEFEGAYAELVGEEGRGVATILEMGTYCRLDCVLGTAGLMRGAASHALHHARHRHAFGRALAAQPLMRNVLADLALEAEAAMALAMRLARAFDAGDDAREAPFRRIVTPAAKFWVCKRGPALAAEAMEVLGGNGYVEEGPLARLYRQMPLNSIWEGAGNIVCLDVLRAMRRDPRCVDVLFEELAAARGGHAALDAFVDRLQRTIAAADEAGARTLAQHVALALQGALLVRFAPSFVADAFCVSRLAGDGFAGGAFGLLPASVAASDIIDRAWPG
jgi:putative acyl-CoA dehydrogenase